MSASTIYNLEAIVENAWSGLMEANSITCITTQTTQDFQSIRPRVNAEFILGQGKGRWKRITDSSGTSSFIECAWSGQMKLDLITAAKVDVHNAFRVLIRSVMFRFPNTVNGVAPMDNHRIQNFQMDAGTTPIWKPQEGDYVSSMSFSLELAVQNNAWAQLET